VPGEITETPDVQGAYPRLSDAQIAALTGQGDRRGTQPGEILFGEGERDCDFYVVLAGHMASVEGHGTDEERIISVHGRGRFLGELSLLTGEGSFYTALALDAGEVLAVSVDRLRELIAHDPAFAPTCCAAPF
jgi:thioredoxin reductase (NADPH)